MSRRVCLGVLVCLVALCVYPHKGNAETPDVSSSSPTSSSLFWGSYNPNVYIGMRGRSSSALNTGVMWHDWDSGRHPSALMDALFHRCEHSDRLGKWGWTRHDGRSFGLQSIVDVVSGIEITSQFLKRSYSDKDPGEWTLRVQSSTLNFQSISRNISLIFYMTIEEGQGEIMLKGLKSTHSKGSRHPRQGLSNDVDIIIDAINTPHGDYSLVIPSSISRRQHPSDALYRNATSKSVPDLSQVHYLNVDIPSDRLWRVRDLTLSQLMEQKWRKSLEAKEVKGSDRDRRRRAVQSTKGVVTLDDVEQRLAALPVSPVLPNIVMPKSNVILLQFILQTPFSLDFVLLQKNYKNDLEMKKKVAKASGMEFNQKISQKVAHFDQRFDSLFQLVKKDISPLQQVFAKETISNLLGGIGYFYGTHLVSSVFDETSNSNISSEISPKKIGPFALTSTTPSRPFFPRGFLWDEGFMQLVVGVWDPSLSRTILQSWIDRIDDDGWVAREQILGAEAESRVPEEFRIQNRHFANPPALLLPIHRIAKNILDSNSKSSSIENNNISFGSNSANETLLADEAFLRKIYPSLVRNYNWFFRTQRGQLPYSFRWRGRSSDHTLTSGLDDYPRSTSAVPRDDERHLDLHSWMTYSAGALADVATVLGLQSDAKKHHRDRKELLAHLDEYHWNPRTGTYCDYTGVVDSVSNDPNNVASPFAEHVGYVSLFPFMFGLITVDDERLSVTFNLITSKDELWSGFGLRSLSKSSPLFESKENYWRGPIWIPINYLVLSSLKKIYCKGVGPFQSIALSTYTALRSDLINNVFCEWHRTGFVWENYSGSTGVGRGSRPFTGWTSLIVLMMSEDLVSLIPSSR